jgi:hypothetical protein
MSLGRNALVGPANHSPAAQPTRGIRRRPLGPSRQGLFLRALAYTPIAAARTLSVRLLPLTCADSLSLTLGHPRQILLLTELRA